MPGRLHSTRRRHGVPRARHPTWADHRPRGKAEISRAIVSTDVTCPDGLPAKVGWHPVIAAAVPAAWGNEFRPRPCRHHQGPPPTPVAEWTFDASPDRGLHRGRGFDYRVLFPRQFAGPWPRISRTPHQPAGDRPAPCFLPSDHRARRRCPRRPVRRGLSSAGPVRPDSICWLILAQCGSRTRNLARSPAWSRSGFPPADGSTRVSGADLPRDAQGHLRISEQHLG